MSSTTQPTTFSDLYTDLMNRVRADTGETPNIEQSKRYINTSLMDMHIGSFGAFPWAEREAVLTTHPTFSDLNPAGSLGIVLTTGSAAVIISQTLTNALLDNNSYGQPNMRPGGKFKAKGFRDVYTVSAVSDTGTHNITLENIWVGDSVLTAEEVGYTYYEDEYALTSDFLRPVDARRLTPADRGIRLIGRNDFRKNYGGTMRLGDPLVGTIIDAPASGNTTPRRRLRLFPAPDTVRRIPYAYITNQLVVLTGGTTSTQFANDTDEPIVPLQYRHAIVLHALAQWYRDKEDDSSRYQLVQAQYEQIVTRIRDDDQIGQSRLRIHPRNTTRRAARRPIGNTGSRFDRGEFDYGGN